tara:strand:- start:509 stop:1120 length:612 start_codon:yes stop_codon:yes gene_type:complete
MAEDKKISDLNLNPSIDGTEEVPTEKGGSNFKNTYTGLKNWILSSISGFVETITGDGVNNTDPFNPVMSYPSPSDIGLGNVDNTSDVDKPISTDTQTALNGKLNVNSLNAFTDNANVPNGTNGETLTLENAVNKTFTFTTTSFTNVGDFCLFSSIGVGFPLLAVGTGVVFNKSDEDEIALAEFNKKGAMRLEDVSGDVVIELF